MKKLPVEQISLWKRIEKFSLDDPEASSPFSQRLARENNWDKSYTERVIKEYKRFAFLSITEGPFTPSVAVDEAWHLHLIYTRSYDKFCSEALQKKLHHNPSKGGKAEHEKFIGLYNGTLTSYESVFGDVPPLDIWPDASVRFSCTTSASGSQQATEKTSEMSDKKNPIFLFTTVMLVTAVVTIPLEDIVNLLSCLFILFVLGYIFKALITSTPSGDVGCGGCDGCGGCGGCGCG